MNWGEWINQIVTALMPYFITFMTGMFILGTKYIYNRIAALEKESTQTKALAAESKIQATASKELAVESKELNEKTLKLLQKNTEITQDLQKNGGVTAKLQKIATTAAFKAGEIKGRASARGIVDQDELDRYEEEFRRSLNKELREET